MAGSLPIASDTAAWLAEGLALEVAVDAMSKCTRGRAPQPPYRTRWRHIRSDTRPSGWCGFGPEQAEAEPEDPENEPEPDPPEPVPEPEPEPELGLGLLQ